ncbi:hypothetical protein FJT64_020101 [Amphibalanus amphitrite]|uniref:Uncharacterized protein n=1 Tax=Amphibalanus amphitrite TaxID=1232801 RepID=A0A6A4X2U6_AMPAM|nr:hypothetical protein FJT64_020101 [Amphibalanus amphitrite]
MEVTSAEPDLPPELSGPPDPAALDYSGVPQPVAALVILLASLSLLGAVLLARFLDLTVLRPAWAARDLPCENALCLLFSVAVADVLQAGCALVGGLQLVIGHWFLSRPLCRLWALLDAVAGTARLLFLLAINGRLLRDDHWPRPVKVWLVSLLWLLVIAGSYLAVGPFGVRHDRTCGLRHEEHVLEASLWQYVVSDAAGVALLPVAVVTYLWYHGRTPGGADGAEDGPDRGSAEQLDGDGDEGAEDTAEADKEEPQNGDTETPSRPKGDAEAAGATAAAASPPASPMPYAQRVRKLERCDTYTPSTFTLKKFWGMPSVDELSSSSGFTGLGEEDGDGEEEEAGRHRRRRRRLTLHQVTELRSRVHLFMLLLSLAHCAFSAAALVTHVLADLRLTSEEAWHTTALVLDVMGQLQPLTTVLIFSCMFLRFYKVLCK